MAAMLCLPAAEVVATQKAAAVPTGKVEAAAKEEGGVGDSKDEAVKAPTKTVVARPRLPAAMAAAPNPPKVVPPRRDATGVEIRVIGGSTAWRSYAAVATDGGTLMMSAPSRERKLCWRRRTTMIMMTRSRLQLSRPERQATAAMLWAEWGKKSRLSR